LGGPLGGAIRRPVWGGEKSRKRASERHLTRKAAAFSDKNPEGAFKGKNQERD